MFQCGAQQPHYVALVTICEGTEISGVGQSDVLKILQFLGN